MTRQQNEMVERVARAIYEGRNGQVGRRIF